MVSVLSGLDRELDIAKDTLWLGSITATSLAVRSVNVANGQMAYITTYGFPLR
jgi:IMP cyclohydrolase